MNLSIRSVCLECSLRHSLFGCGRVFFSNDVSYTNGFWNLMTPDFWNFIRASVLKISTPLVLGDKELQFSLHNLVLLFPVATTRFLIIFCFSLQFIFRMASGNSRSKMDYIKDHKIHVLFEQVWVSIQHCDGCFFNGILCEGQWSGLHMCSFLRRYKKPTCFNTFLSSEENIQKNPLFSKEDFDDW